jgi:hypothetical protein
MCKRTAGRERVAAWDGPKAHRDYFNYKTGTFPSPEIFVLVGVDAPPLLSFGKCCCCVGAALLLDARVTQRQTEFYPLVLYRLKMSDALTTFMVSTFPEYGLLANETVCRGEQYYQVMASAFICESHAHDRRLTSISFSGFPPHPPA